MQARRSKQQAKMVYQYAFIAPSTTYAPSRPAAAALAMMAPVYYPFPFQPLAVTRRVPLSPPVTHLVTRNNVDDESLRALREVQVKPEEFIDNGENYTLKLNLPGVKKDKITISVSGRLVTLNGVVQHEEKKNGYEFSSSSTVRRCFVAPGPILANDIKQEWSEDGFVLLLTLPKDTSAPSTTTTSEDQTTKEVEDTDLAPPSVWNAFEMMEKEMEEFWAPFGGLSPFGRIRMTAEERQQMEEMRAKEAEERSARLMIARRNDMHTSWQRNDSGDIEMKVMMPVGTKRDNIRLSVEENDILRVSINESNKTKKFTIPESVDVTGISAKFDMEDAKEGEDSPTVNSLVITLPQRKAQIVDIEIA